MSDFKKCRWSSASNTFKNILLSPVTLNHRNIRTRSFPNATFGAKKKAFCHRSSNDKAKKPWDQVSGHERWALNVEHWMERATHSRVLQPFRAVLLRPIVHVIVTSEKKTIFFYSSCVNQKKFFWPSWSRIFPKSWTIGRNIVQYTMALRLDLGSGCWYYPNRSRLC